MDVHAPLAGVHRADAAIVGGGLTGLLTADFLSGEGLRTALVTDGLPACPGPLIVSLQQPEAFRRIAAHHGQEALREHVGRLRRVLRALPGWLEPLAPFREAEVYAYARMPQEVPLLEMQRALLKGLRIGAQIAPDAGGCPFPVTLSMRSPALLIDSQRLAESLVRRIAAAGGRVFTGSRVVNASASAVFTAEGRVDAPLVLLCTGKPLGLCGRRLLALLETRTTAHCRLTPPVPLHTVQTAVLPGGLALLPSGGVVHAAWDAWRTGTREEALRSAYFRRILHSRLPDWQAEPPDHRLQVRTADGLPMVGGLPAEGGQVLFASGAEDFPTAVLAAQALARLALHRPTPADLLLRPDRPLPRRAVRQALRRLRRHRVVNALRTGAPRCSHCACRLRFFEAARWWGCPCCGSAYGVLGSRVGGPTLADAEISAAQRPGW